MPTVFISHATKDAAFAQRLAQHIEAAGATVWIAPDSIHPGEDFPDAIGRGLGEATHFLLLASPASMGSKWVELEMSLAVKLNRDGKLAIAPIQLEKCDLPLIWSAFHYLAYDGDFTKLANQLADWLGIDPTPFWEPKAIEADELTRRQAELERIAQEVAVCDLCPLHLERYTAVPGAGPANARVFFIGEAPGPEDDQTGQPFVSAAGEFLDELLEMIDMSRDDVFLTNIVKCRPNENRDPKAAEQRACSGYLQRQIDIINPDVIVTLGRHALKRILPGAKISEVHGHPQEVQGRIVYPMYHPAAALYRARYRTLIIKDMLEMGRYLEGLK